MSAHSFGQQVLGLLRKTLAPSFRYGHLTFESLTLEANDGDYDLVAVFRHVDYPGCLFGYRWTRVYSYALKAYSLEEAADHGQQDLIRDQADAVVANFIDNLHEEVYAGNGDLPRDCDPDSVTWINPAPSRSELCLAVLRTAAARFSSTVRGRFLGNRDHCGFL